MRCDFCKFYYFTNPINKERNCKQRRVICNKFELADDASFYCKKWQCLASLSFCNFKVINHWWCCTQSCKQFQEMLMLANKYLEPFPDLPRLNTSSYGRWHRETKKFAREFNLWCLEKNKRERRGQHE